MSKIDEKSSLNDFTIALAMMDFLPVLFFLIGTVFLYLLLGNVLLLIGGIISFISGLIKVIWKLIVVLKKEDIKCLFIQMRIFMPIGFLVVLIGLIVAIINGIDIVSYIVNPLSLTSLILGIIFLVGMIICSIKLDSSSLKANYIEQTINSLCQFLVAVSIVFAYFLK